MHHAQIAGTETKKLKGQIFDLERKAGLRPLIRPSSGVPHRMGDSLDVLGHIPWHPAGRGRSTTPLCKASPEMNTVSLEVTAVAQPAYTPAVFACPARKEITWCPQCLAKPCVLLLA